MDLLKGLKIAILLTDGFEQVEMVKPRKALEAAGAKIFLVSNKSKIQGWHHAEKGDIFEVDTLLDKANPNDFDALLLPGGVMNPNALRMIPEVITFIKKMNEENKLIAAICHGPWLLINAQIVKGKQITSWPSIKTDLINAGGIWLDKSVVLDKNIITSRKPDDIPDFNREIIKQLHDLKNKQ